MVFVPVPTPPPCRREAFCIRVPLPCGRTQVRLCAYSYSISIIVCCPWFVSNSPTHPSYLVESVVEYPPLRLRSASRCTKGICLFIFYQYRLRLHLARRVRQDVCPSLPIVVCRDGSPQSGGGVHWRKVSHTLSISLVCPRRALCPPRICTRLCRGVTPQHRFARVSSSRG